MNYASDQVDDRGWSIADHILDIDEGGAAPGATPMPGIRDPQLRKAQAARLKRGKRAYGILLKHITDPDHISHITLTYFQQGQQTWNYLVGVCQVAINATRLRELNAKWDGMDLLADVGVDENSILNLCTTESRF